MKISALPLIETPSGEESVAVYNPDGQTQTALNGRILVSSLMGISGPPGPRGSIGLTGATGAQGVQGPQGETGPAGPDRPTNVANYAALASIPSNQLSAYMLVSTDDTGFTWRLQQDLTTWVLWPAPTNLATFEVEFLPGFTTLLQVGQTLTTPEFTAAYTLGSTTITPTTAVLTDSSDSTSQNVTSTPTSFSSTNSYTENTYDAQVEFTLTAGYGGLTDASTVTATWLQKVYWGVGAAGENTASFILGLAGSNIQSSRNTTFTVDPGAGQKFYFASRAAYGVANFTIGGFSGGVNAPSTVSVTNEFGFTENYYLYESVQPNLGSTTVSVT